MELNFYGIRQDLHDINYLEYASKTMTMCFTETIDTNGEEAISMEYANHKEGTHSMETLNPEFANDNFGYCLEYAAKGDGEINIITKDNERVPFEFDAELLKGAEHLEDLTKKMFENESSEKEEVEK